MITLDAPTDAERRAARRRSTVRKSDRTRDTIVAGCRACMMDGDFRPSAALIARRARVSVRTVFHYFPKIAGLYVAAIDLDLVLDLHRRLERLDPTELVKAAVLGRMPQ